MTEDANPLDELLAPLAGADPVPDPAEHPSDGTLSAYAEGKLAEAEELEVQEHLAVCGRCRGLLLDFASFVEVPLAERVEGVADLEAAKEWRALQARMTGEGGAFSTRIQEPERDRRLVKQLRVFQTVAAVLGAAVVGISLYAFSVRGHSEKIVAMPETSLDFSVVRGEQSPEERVSPPCALKFFVTPKFPSYQIEILSKGERVVYSGGPYLRKELEQLTLPIGHDLLPPGIYTIRVSGLSPARRPEPIGKPAKLLVKP